MVLEWTTSRPTEPTGDSVLQILMARGGGGHVVMLQQSDYCRDPDVFQMTVQATLKQLSSSAALGLAVTVASFGGSANAATIFNFSKTPALNSTSEPFVSNGITLTLQNSNSSGELNNNTLNFNNAGLCAFAAVGTSSGRCGYGAGVPSGGITAFQAVFSKPVAINSFEVSDFSDLLLSSALFEVSLDNTTFTPFSFTSTGTVSLGGVVVQANQTIFIKTSGIFSTPNQSGLLRINNLNVTEVPGPLGIMGLAGAIGWSKQLKKRTKNL